MKKRLRKKLNVGEFAKMCFLFTADYECDDEDALWCRFADKVEELELLCTGMWDEGKIELCFEAGAVGTGEEERRTALVEWIKDQPEYKDVIIGELFDSNDGYLED